MIDERTLAATLAELGRDVTAPPEPAAAARRRARVLRRRRLAAGATLTAAALLAGAGTALSVRSHEITGWAAADRPTSKLVTVLEEPADGSHAYRVVVYAHGDRLCAAVLGVVSTPISRCEAEVSLYRVSLPLITAPVIGRIGSPAIDKVTALLANHREQPGQIVAVPGTRIRAYVIGLGPGDVATQVLGYEPGRSPWSELGLVRPLDILGHGAPQSSEAVSMVVPGTTLQPPGLRRWVWWDGRDFCTDVWARERMLDGTNSLCSADGSLPVRPGRMTAIRDVGGVGVLGTLEPGAVRVDATLRGGSTLSGAVVDGWGFPLPVFFVPLPPEQVVSVASYDAHDRLLGRHVVHLPKID